MNKWSPPPFLTMVSSTVLALVVLTAIMARWIDPTRDMFTFGPAFHVSSMTWGRSFGPGRIVFFSDADYGPYHGSMLNVIGNPTPPKVSSFGDWAGIYYRHITSTRFPGQSLWTLAVSLWYPLIVFSILPGWWAVRWFCRNFQVRATSERKPG